MRLTRREVEVLQLVRQSLRNGQIATRLGVSEDTIKNTLTSAFRKLQVGNRQDAAAIFTRDWDEFGRYLGSPHVEKTASDQVAGANGSPPGRYRPPERGVLFALMAQGQIALLTIGVLVALFGLAWIAARLF